MDSKDIPSKMIELHAAVNDKSGELSLTPDLSFYPNLCNGICLTVWPHSEAKNSKYFWGNNLEDLFAKAFVYVNNLPSEYELNIADFQSDLANLIDKGRNYNIDFDFMNPLIATSKNLAENKIEYKP